MLNRPNTIAVPPASVLRKAVLAWLPLCLVSQMSAWFVFSWAVMLGKVHGAQGAQFFFGSPLRVTLFWMFVLGAAFAIPLLLWFRLRVVRDVPRLLETGAGIIATLFMLVASLWSYMGVAYLFTLGQR